MDTSSVLMGLLLLMLFIAPVIYLITNQTSREKNRRKILMLYSHKDQVFPDQTEFLNLVSLGFDKKAHKLAVIQQVEPIRKFVLDLKEYKSCKLALRSPHGISNNSLDAIEEVSLLFTSSGGYEKEIFFYQDEWDSASEKETCIEAARKWQQLLTKNSTAATTSDISKAVTEA